MNKSRDGEGRSEQSRGIVAQSATASEDRREASSSADDDHHDDHSDHDHGGHFHSRARHLHAANRHDDKSRDRLRLLAAFALTVVMMIFEAVGGWLSGSLALLSDSGHMLTDAAALLLAVIAMWFASKPADQKRTFGFFRLEILSGLVNGIALIAIALVIAYEAWQRIANPLPIKTGLMFSIAVVGLVVNLIGMFLLSHSHNLNIRGAFLHIVGDAFSSIGVIVAAVIAWFTGWTMLDPIISIAIGVIIAFGATGLIREAIHVLLDSVPRHIELSELIVAIRAIPGVTDVHDLHVWTISHSTHALSAHLVCPLEMVDREQVLNAVRALLREKFEIEHATLQLERERIAQCEHAH